MGELRAALSPPAGWPSSPQPSSPGLPPFPTGEEGEDSYKSEISNRCTISRLDRVTSSQRQGRLPCAVVNAMQDGVGKMSLADLQHWQGQGDQVIGQLSNETSVRQVMMEMLSEYADTVMHMTDQVPAETQSAG